MSTISETIAHDEPSDVQESLEVRRDAPLSLLVGGSAGILAVAFLLRGVGSGTPLDWGLFLLTAVVATMHLAAVVDARAPLLVLDQLGARVRRGALWQGVAWGDVDHLEHRARSSTVRDGSLTIVTTDGRRLGVRLSLSTRLIGADWHEVDDALIELSGASVPIVRPDLEAKPSHHTDAPVDAASVTAPAPLDTDEPAGPVETAEPIEPVETAEAEGVLPTGAADDDTAVTPSRDSRPAVRGELLLDAPATSPEAHVDPDGEELEPAAAETRTILVDAVDAVDPRDQLDHRDTPAPAGPVEPVVGNQLAAARARVGISVESLAERTRIRPHVIEAIERDDFDSCGGDFYARGHLRTLARVLGVDATALLALYDEHYAHAPIDARRVFEAELAGAPVGAQAARGLNWSVLVAAVMAVVLVWSVARLVMDGPVPLTDQPVLNGSPGGKATLSGATTKVPVKLTAATGGARVIVRDARQQVVFDAQLAFMQTAELSVVPPVNISTTDGGLLVTVDGTDQGPMGATGQSARQTYVP